MKTLTRYALLTAFYNTNDRIREYRGHEIEFKWRTADNVLTVDVLDSPLAALVIDASSNGCLAAIRDLDMLIDIVDEYDNSDASRARALRISTEEPCEWSE